MGDVLEIWCLVIWAAMKGRRVMDSYLRCTRAGVVI